MADHSAYKTGYTRTGKSLKAIRRFYALKGREEQEKRRKEGNHDIPRYSPGVSRRRHPPEDDKLSRRIAAELKVQQEAIEKRSRSINSPTERSALPVLIQNKERGPVFVTEVVDPPKVKSLKSARSAKSAKSARSIKSLNAEARELERIELAMMKSQQLGSNSIGCIMTSFLMSLGYLITWISMLSLESARNKLNNPRLTARSSYNSIRWLALNSLAVLVAVPYWLRWRHSFKHAFIALCIMTLSTISLVVYQVYALILDEKIEPESRGSKEYFVTNNPLNFWMSVTYLLFHLIAVSLMIKQLIYLVSKQIGDKRSEDANPMSQYLAPR